MVTPAHPEPYELTPRFFRALQAKALCLELDALRDEITTHSISNLDQLRRHRLLVQAQRDEAARLRDFLTRTQVARTAATSG